jgi:alpha-amylase/alpha-mannosidase (GH57 family)
MYTKRNVTAGPNGTTVDQLEHIWWYMCVHLHLYQPPREDPFTGVIEAQPSASPCHDWNERITKESYAPLGNAAIKGGDGSVLKTVNCYSLTSFNVGPTLLMWLRRFAPEVFAKMVEGDQFGLERTGHHNAIAQVFNHVIMPLQTPAQRRLQVKWGIEAYRSAFGDDPEGMWLGECAVNTDTLEALAESGIKFTVLAPRQARRVRKLDSNDWLNEEVDPTRAYLCRLPSGREISVFFYNGGLSSAVAFERLTGDGGLFLSRLKSAFRWIGEKQLVHVGTDGETYGHHAKFGEMGLAWVVDQVRNADGIRLTNYGEFLEHCAPTWEVELHENSSWSCAHGVERWRSNCGCREGDEHPDQSWRGPLRAFFDTVSKQAEFVFWEKSGAFFPNPQSALENFIRVELDPAYKDSFARDYMHANLSADAIADAFDLLQMMLQEAYMYTSCAWYFNEISRVEPVHNLENAAYALVLAEEFDEHSGAAFLDDALKALEGAYSNIKELGTGRDIWNRWIAPRIESARQERAALREARQSRNQTTWAQCA